MNNEKTNISSISIALLLFIAIFGITNIPANYAALGNSAIGWFILLGFYFIPSALVIGELSSHKLESKSGMHGWIKLGLGNKWAFMGVWSYFIVNIFYLPTLASRIPVLFSWTFTTGDFSLNDVVTNAGNIPGTVNAVDSKILFLGLTFITFIIALFLGLHFKKFFSSFAKYIGWGTLIITGLFIVMGIGGVLLNNQPIANPITVSNTMPHLNIVALSTFAWIVFAISGIETIGSYIPHVKNAKKIIPTSILLAAILVIGGYIIGFITLSLCLTPEQVPTNSLENLIPIIYAQVGDFWGLGALYLKVITFTYLIITITALVLWLNATVTSLFEDFPKGIFNDELMSYKFNDVPIFGFLLTLVMVILLLLLSSTSVGENVYYTLYDMTTIAVLLPYLLIGVSFIGFCLKKDVEFKIIKNKIVGIIMGAFIVAMTSISMIFSIFDLTLGSKDEIISWAITSGGGLLFFLLIGFGLYKLKENKVVGSIILSVLILLFILFLF